MTRRLLPTLLLGLLVSAGASPQPPMTYPAGEPILLDDDAGYLELVPEAQFREKSGRLAGEEGFIPLKPGPTGLSMLALFDVILVPDHVVTLAVDRDGRGGYSLFADLDADGDVRDNPPWPMEKREAEVWDFSGQRTLKEAWVGEVDTASGRRSGGEEGSARVKLRVTYTEDRVRIPGVPEPMPQAILAESTLRKGTVAGRGRGVAFALRGVGGTYNDDFNAVLFDLNGDGRLDPSRRASAEYFWVWERNVTLNGKSYEFSVDRQGRALTLKPLARRLPDRPSLEVGQPAPEFSFVDFGGKRRRLRDYRGKVVLLDFWGTWCPACVADAAALVSAYRRLHGKGFEILGIHGGGSEEEVRKFVADYGMTWPQTLETGAMPGGRPLQSLYRFLGAPNYFLVDRDGILIANDLRKPDLLIREVEKRLGAGR